MNIFSKRQFLVLCFLISFLSGFSQTQSFNSILSLDSLSGFNEAATTLEATSSGLFGEEFKAFMQKRKREYVNDKYNLPIFDYEASYVANYRTSPSVINALPCVNEDFEANSFAGWTLGFGTSNGAGMSACVNNPCTVTPVASSLAAVVSTPFFDSNLGFNIPNSPLGGTRVARLNTPTLLSPFQFPVVKISQAIPVTVTNSLYDFAYYAIAQAGSPHGCCDQAYMYVKMRDCFGNLLSSCPVFSITAPGGTCAGTGPTSWTLAAGKYRSNGWQRYSIDLAQYIGCTITIEVTVGHCQLGGHYGYAYFDSNCNAMNFTVNTNTVSAPSPAPVTATVACGTTATLIAPSGLGPYSWVGPAGSGITSTNQAITTTIAGNYSVSMTPLGICNPINRIISLRFPPPATLNVAPSSSICTTGAVTSATLSATGAANYTWSPPGFPTNFIVVSPTTTSIYTLTAVTGTCAGTWTQQVTVSPTPTVNILTSNTSLCPGQVGTLTALGANTYSWLNPPTSSSQSITVTQNAATVYTVVGTTTAGCSNTATQSIAMSIAPTINAVTFGPTLVCSGSPVQLAGFGATTFSWFPGVGQTNNPQTVTPFTTTTYTAIGASGTCTNSAVITISVDPGPTLTVLSSPTLICPYNSATLTATGPSALGYTWQPAGTNGTVTVVSPTTQTTYSVFAINALGCISRYTVEPVVAPVPTLVISPTSPSLCLGSALTLTVRGGTTYTWLPGATSGSTAPFSPTTNSTYTTLGSNGTCTSSIISTITVVPLPTVSITSSVTAICLGQSVTLNANGGTTYTWLPVNQTASSIVVSPAVTTIYTLTGNTAACEANATVTITVNNPPTLTLSASPSAICPGFSSTLTAAGAASYTWNPGGVNTATNLVSPANTTTYTATGASTFGCTRTQSIVLAVNPVPTINVTASSPSICAGRTATLSATGALTYTWLPGSGTGSAIAVSPTASTIYTVSGVNAQGCITTRTINLNIVPNPTVVPVASPTAVCVGFSATLSATGAVSYVWLPGSIASSSIVVNPTVNTTYSVIGSTAGCSTTNTVQLLINNGPTVTIAATPTAICPGGTSTLSALGATAYTWMPGGFNTASATVSPASGTTYTLTSASAFGCLTTSTVTVNVNPTPTINLTSSSASICVGSTASLTASGAASYTWLPVGLTGSQIAVSPVINTSYTVNASSALGCAGTKTISLTVVPNPTITPVASPTAICAGSTATLSATGATNYTWMPGSSTGSAVAVSPTVSTTYTVTGNTAGCSTTNTVQLLINNGPTVTVAATPTAICPGGTSTLSALGAAAYTWMPGGFTTASATVSPATGTTYTLTSASAFGCLTTSTVSVNVNPTPTINLTSSSASICVGGTASLTATGAATYTWLPGVLSGSQVAVSPTTNTTYTVNASSALGCAGTNTISLTVVPIPTINPVASPTAVCAGSTATLSATGATNFTWMPGSSTGSSIAVSPTINTTYTVTGNTAGCSTTNTVQLLINNGPTVTVAATPTAICPGGISTLSAVGATSYTWMPGGFTTASATVSPATGTTYTLTSASAFACLTTSTVSVNVNPTPTINLTSSSASICVGSTASLSATGAATYTWLPGVLSGSQVAVTPTINTTYTVNASSNFGCAGVNTIAITVVPVPTINAVASATAICVGFTTTLSATGATNYTWTPGFITGSLVVVSPTINTNYLVTGNTAGCTSTAAVQVIVNNGPPLAAAASPTAVCPGFTSLLTAGGAVSYTWNPGNIISSNITATPTPGNTYTVIGESAFGCLTTQTLSVLVLPTPTVNLTSSSASICVGGTASLTATGAATYTWLPVSLSGSQIAVTPATNTTYTVNASSALGCVGTNTIDITVVPIPTINPVASPTAICLGSTATLSATGATNYTWMPGSSTGSSIAVSPTVNSTYTVTGTTAGCSTTNTIQLIINNGPTVTVAATPTAICPGGTSTLSAVGATSYTWMPGGFNTATATVSPTTGTTYTLTSASAFACLTTSTVSVNVNPTPTINLAASSSTICVGGTASLTATGAATYTWLPGVLSGSQIAVSPIINTIYTVNASSALGCAGTNTIDITVVPIPTINPVASPTAVCAGSTATLSATGATNYTWMPGTLTGSSVVVSPAVNTTYTITGNTAGCSTTNTVQLIINNGPTVTVAATPTAICPGGTSTLSAVGATSYTWMPGGFNTATATVSPTTGTTYTLISASAFACLTTSTVSVNVNPTPTINLSAFSSTICVGGTASLTATGAATYFWLPVSLSGSQVAVTPTSNTTYTVNANSGFGCAGTNTIDITVVPIPTISPVASATAICAGSTATLSATGATNYSWTPGTLTGSSVAVSPISNTTYTVTGSTAGCSITNTVLLNINALPSLSIAATNTNLCTGNSATLTASGALNYTWSPGASNNLTLSVTPVATSAYTLQGINAAGCTNTTQMTVNVNTTPTVGVAASSSVICAGETSTIALTGAASFTTNPGALTGSLITLSPASTQTYSILGLSGTCQSSAAITITVNPLPAITASTSTALLCTGSSATLTAGGAISYTWSPGALTGSAVSVSPLSVQNYTVNGTSALGCVGTQTVTQVVAPTPTMNIVSSSTAVCIGSAATLTATGALNYTWFPSLSTGSVLVVNPLNTSSYTLVGDNGGICAQSVTTSINVNSLPTLTVNSTSTVLCSGATTTIDVNGALTYTWLPSGTGSISVESPTLSTTYTITGSDVNLCTSAQTLSIIVNANPTLTALASPTTICEGATTSLTAGGALSYTWLPAGLSGSLVTITPTVTTNYTVSGSDINGCVSTSTVDVDVLSNPVLTISAMNASICAGQSNTLTVTGGLSYTWQPGASAGSTVAVNPLITTDYSVTATGTNICAVTETITVSVNPLPANLTANATATISCGTPSIGLLSTSTDTNVIFNWTGPNSFTSAISNPSGIAVAGDYTVVVTDTVTGCSDSLVATVINDNSIPSLSVTISPSITCSNPAPVIFAANTTTNAGYNWTGPQSFTSSVSNPTVTVGGTYTLILTDLSSGCSDTTSIIVGTHTRVVATATMAAPTCSAGLSNNNGMIGLVNFNLSDRFGLVAGATFTGSQTYTNAAPIPSSGIVTSTIANPITTALYTLRIFDSLGCTKDSTFMFEAVNCIYRTLGISKAVSIPSLNPDGSYEITYSVTVQNYDASALAQIDLTDNLAAVFPLPTTFTVKSAPATYSGSGITLNSQYDGKTQTKLSTAASSSLAPGASQSFRFVLDVNTPLFYKNFNNSIIGTAVNGFSANVSDSSNAGFNTDPKLNVPTTTSFVPNVLFGLTSEASFIEAGQGTYDVTYTVTAFNLGNDTLRNVAIRQDFATAIRNPATYTHIKAPETFGGLVANAGYGTANVHLLDSTNSRLDPRSFGRVIFSIRVVADTQSVIITNAFGSAIHRSANNPTLITRATDVSNNGVDPDRDDNQICNESFDNAPTVVVLPLTFNLFIPEGFSPDGDGINDRFVITGMPQNGKSTLTIYNRWGNKIYKAENYYDAEPWDGVPTVGSTPGNGKVTQGTYYYVLELYTDSVKRISGYIIVQY